MSYKANSAVREELISKRGRWYTASHSPKVMWGVSPKSGPEMGAQAFSAHGLFA